MARKVFISFLGTNNYVECKYMYNGIVSEPVRFIQEALIAQICINWTEGDKILIFCTSKDTTGEDGSKEINWLDCDTRGSSVGNVGLKHRLELLCERVGIKPSIEEVDIEAGFSEEEIWNIFDVVYHQLQPADEIYFDVTHAFRSIPLFSVVLFNYSKFMMGTRLRRILYGAFEKLGSAQKVKEMPIDTRVAPVVDLTNIARLQEYNQVASGLKEFGKVKQIKDVIVVEQQLSPSDQALRELSASVTELDEYIATIDLKNIKSGKYIVKFRNNYKNIRRKGKLVKPISRILEELYNETSDFVCENDFRNIEAAINWTLKHDMLMQTFPLAEEYIILKVVDMLGDLRPTTLKSNKKYRQFISSILGMPEEDFKMKNWKNELADYPDAADEISEEPLIRELRPKYDKIRDARNSLAHGNGSVSYQGLRDLIPVIIDCVAYLNVAYKEYSSTQYVINNLCC